MPPSVALLPTHTMPLAAPLVHWRPSSAVIVHGKLKWRATWQWLGVPSPRGYPWHWHHARPSLPPAALNTRVSGSTVYQSRRSIAATATAAAGADAMVGSWQHLIHFEVHPAVWLMLATWVLASTQAAATRAAAAAAASAGGPVEPPPSTTAVPGTAAGLLSQVYVNLLLPCQLLLLASATSSTAAASDTILFLLAVVYGVLLTLTGSALGWLSGSIILATWQQITRQRPQPAAATAAAATWPGGSNQGSGSLFGSMKPTKRRRWLPVKLARWWARTSRALWSPVPSAEAALAAATASALGAPQAAGALIPLKPVAPAWAPAAFTCLGTAAALSAAAPLAASTSLPALANGLAEHAVASIQAWFLDLPAAAAAGAAVGSAASATAVPWAATWFQGTVVGQHALLWSLLLPCLSTAVSWMPHKEKARGQDAWLGRLRVSPQEPGHATPATPDSPLSWVGMPISTASGSSKAGVGQGQWAASNASGAAQTAQSASTSGTSSVDLSEARVWVKVGNNQEVLLTPRELAQLVPFNTPLPGRLMPGGQPGLGGGLGLGGGDPSLQSLQSLQSATSMDGELGGEVVEAEVRDMISTSDDTDRHDDDGAQEGQDTEVASPWWQKAWASFVAAAASNPPLVALLIGLLLRATHMPGLASTALAEGPAAAFQHAAPAWAPPLPDVSSLSQLSSDGLRQAHGHFGASFIPHVLDLPQLDPGIVTSLAGSVPDMDFPSSSFVPWDGRLIQLGLKTCVMCIAWAGAAAPWALALFAGCTAAAACLSMSSSAGFTLGGLLDGKPDGAGSGDGGWGLSLGNWKAYAGNRLPEALRAMRRLLIPANVSELVLAACGVIAAHGVLPVALAWLAQAVTQLVHTNTGQLHGMAGIVIEPVSRQAILAQLSSSSAALLGSAPLLLLLLLRPILASSPSKAMGVAQAQACLLVLRCAFASLLVQLVQGPVLNFV